MQGEHRLMCGAMVCALLVGGAVAYAEGPTKRVQAKTYIPPLPPGAVRSEATCFARGDVDIYTQPYLAMPTGWEEPVEWKYTTTAPSTEWMTAGFDDSDWTTGPGAFSQSPVMPEYRTRWTSNDIWLRKTVELSFSDAAELAIWGKWSEGVEIFINGRLAAQRPGATTFYEFMPISLDARATLKRGKNVIAVHCHTASAPGFVDVGIAYDPWFRNVPVQGRGADPRLMAFAKEIFRVMKEDHVPAATATISYKEKIVADWGFGWADKWMTRPTPPGTIFRLASVDKVITKMALMKMISDKTIITPTGERLSMETKVFPTFRAYGITPRVGAKIDPKLDKITVRHLVEHSSGLLNLPDPQTIYSTFGITGRSEPVDAIRWTMEQKVQWEPGTKSEYCNRGFDVIRHLLQLVSGDFLAYLQERLCEPTGLSEIAISAEELPSRHPSEIWYATGDIPADQYIYRENVYGLCASTRTMVKLLRRYHMDTGECMYVEGSRTWRPSDNGWHYFYGRYSGTSTIVVQRRWDEVNFAVFFNGNTDQLDRLRDTFMRTIDTMPKGFWTRLHELKLSEQVVINEVKKDDEKASMGKKRASR